MKHIIQIAYLISSLIAMLAIIPQIRQIIKLKRSSEFNITTWISWAICQSISLVYAISVKATAYAAMSVIWISLYAFMAVLIARYKYNVPLLIINARTKVIEQVTSIGATPVIQPEKLTALKNKVNEIIKSLNISS